jgi:hypothetical protein
LPREDRGFAIPPLSLASETIAFETHRVIAFGRKRTDPNQLL